MKQNCLAIGLASRSEKWTCKNCLAGQFLALTKKFQDIQFVFLQL